MACAVRDRAERALTREARLLLRSLTLLPDALAACRRAQDRRIEYADWRTAVTRVAADFSMRYRKRQGGAQSSGDDGVPLAGRLERAI